MKKALVTWFVALLVAVALLPEARAGMAVMAVALFWLMSLLATESSLAAT